MKRFPCLAFAVLMCLAVSGCDRSLPPGDDGPVVRTIADLRGGEVDEGLDVTLEDVVVTSLLGGNGHGFFVQDQLATTNGGMMVYLPSVSSLTIAVGDLVDVTGTFQAYYGQLQLRVVDAASIVKVGTADPMPVPQVTTSAALANAAVAEGYEGMLVKIESATATDVASTPWKLDSLQPVGNYFYTSLPTEGDTVAWIQGIIRHASTVYVLEPRDASDILIVE